MRTLVLGSGPAALAYLHYDRMAVALAGPQRGGQFAITSQLGPQVLWATERTGKLLRELGLNLSTKKVRVGWYVGGKLFTPRDVMGTEFEQRARELYSMRTRGTVPLATHMSDGKREFTAFTVGVEHVVKRLLELHKDRLIWDSAVEVRYDRMLELTTVIAQGCMAHVAERLVSTVPAPKLFAMLRPELKYHVPLQAFDKVYQRLPISELPGDVLDWAIDAARAGMDYVYVPDPRDHVFHRLKIDGHHAVVEYTLPKPAPGFFEPERGFLHQPQGQIVAGHEALERLPKWVMPLGRYAQWRHGIKFHDVLDTIAALEADWHR